MKKRESALAEKWVMVMRCFEFVIRGVWIDDIVVRRLEIMREFCIDDNLHLSRYSMQFYPISLSTARGPGLGVWVLHREGKRRQKITEKTEQKITVVVLLLACRSLMQFIDLSQHSP